MLALLFRSSHKRVSPSHFSIVVAVAVAAVVVVAVAVATLVVAVVIVALEPGWSGTLSGETRHILFLGVVGMECGITSSPLLKDTLLNLPGTSSLRPLTVISGEGAGNFPPSSSMVLFFMGRVEGRSEGWLVGKDEMVEGKMEEGLLVCVEGWLGKMEEEGWLGKMEEVGVVG